MSGRGRRAYLVLALLAAAALTAAWRADVAASGGGLALPLAGLGYDPWIRSGSRLRLPGLWAESDVTVTLGLRPPAAGGALAVEAGGPVETQAAPLRTRQTFTVRGRTDGDGVLLVRVSAAPRGEGRVRILAVDVEQHGPASLPASRWVQYVVLLLLASAFGLWAGPGLRGGVAALGAVATLLPMAILAARVQTLLFLPWALALLAGSLLLAALATRLLQVPRPAAAFVAVTFLLRAGAVLQPEFPSIDSAFHSENVQRFRAHELIESAAPNPDSHAEALPVPYPPLFHALVAPVFPFPWPTPQFPIRLAMALLEGTSPLLLFVFMRSAGASTTAAGLGAACQAAMPEAILVLGKGIAANILGCWTTLLVAIALARGTPSLLPAGLFTLAFLSHLGAGLSLLLLVVVWAGREAWLGRRRAALPVLAAVLAGLAVAWLVYYRAVTGIATETTGALASRLSEAPSDFLRVRWIRVGKFLQDLLLKFGATPLVFAWLGVRRGDAPVSLRGLLEPWLWTGAALGLVAFTSPIPLRFEYFLVPAVAAWAGLGLEHATRLRIVIALAVPAAVQLALLLFLAARRFFLISVILESERWPFPFRL